jgi:hypothetical protein
MPAQEHGSGGAPPLHAQLIQMGTGFIVSRVVYVAAKLGLADLLADGPRTAAELAATTGSHERSLHRLMRTLSSLGVLVEEAGGKFRLTEMGETLKTGAPGSARATILAFGGWCWKAFDELPYAVETGKTGFRKVYGMDAFQYINADPYEASLFSETMIGVHGAEPATVAAAYDFSGFGTIVDVGGSTGNLLVHVLKLHAGPRGVLFDQQAVLAMAPEFLKKSGMEDRISLESGSFFESVPAGGDAYLMSHIIHDWSEEQCLTILGNCRKAMKPDSKVLLVEYVLPADNTPHPGKMLDMVMLNCAGGEERTAEEYAALLGKAGLRMTRVVPTASPVSVVEAVLA